jgi:hypothetical protein
MPLPGPAWLSLPETVQFVIERSREAEDRVRSALIEAALAGTITATGCRHQAVLRPPGPDPARNYARYFAHPVLADREVLPAWAWGTAMISWAQSRVGMYDLVRFSRAEIERWLGTAEPEPRAQHGEPTHPGHPPTGSPAAFVTKYIADCKAASDRATKAGLVAAWQAAGRKGHRDALRKAFDDAMGEEAPTRGRPRKSPE